VLPALLAVLSSTKMKWVCPAAIGRHMTSSCQLLLVTRFDAPTHGGLPRVTGVPGVDSGQSVAT